MPHHSFRPSRPERRRGAAPPACCVARRFRHRSPRRGSLRAGGAARLGVGGGGMSTEQRQFTPGREIAPGAAHETYDESLDKRVGIPFEQFLEYFDYGWWRDARLRWQLAAARAQDRDSRTRLVLQWNSI